MYSGFSGLLQNVRVGNEEFGAILRNREVISRFDFYNYAKSDKAISQFYNLKEATTIDVVYKNFSLVFSDIMKTDKDRHIRSEISIKVFNNLADEGIIDKALLKKLGWNRLQAISKL